MKRRAWAAFAAWLSSSVAISDVCLDRYRKIFANPVVDIRIVIGYKNMVAYGIAEDQFAHGTIIDTVTDPCPPNSAVLRVLACGFQRDPDDAEVFYKKVAGPFGEDQLVKLTVAFSSYSKFDRDNRGIHANEQRRQSEHARELFLSGLRDADVVIYNGHSRKGGGPDFYPARLTPKERTDYEWYHENRPGLDSLVLALGKKTDRHAPLIGIISCYSERYFLGALREHAPSSEFLMTRGLSWWVDEPAKIIGALNAVLAQACEPEFETIMNANPRIDPSSRVYLDGVPKRVH